MLSSDLKHETEVFLHDYMNNLEKLLGRYQLVRKALWNGAFLYSNTFHRTSCVIDWMIFII